MPWWQTLELAPVNIPSGLMTQARGVADLVPQRWSALVGGIVLGPERFLGPVVGKEDKPT